MRPSTEVRLRRLFISLWEVGQGDKAIVALVLGSLVSQANLITSMDRRTRDRLPTHALACRLSVPMLAISGSRCADEYTRTSQERALIGESHNGTPMAPVRAPGRRGEIGRNG